MRECPLVSMNVHAMQAHHHTEMTQTANRGPEELSKDSIHDPLDRLRLVRQQVRSQGARDIEATPHCTQPPIS